MQLSTTKTQREYYNQDRKNACQALGITTNQYNWFRRVGDKLHKIYEEQCNGNESKLLEVEEKFLTKEIYNRAKELRLYSYLQTDPRGATVYLDKEEIPYNNYTKAHCIY